MKAEDVKKHYAALKVSAELLFMTRAWRDSRYNRRVKEVIETPPTEQDWADYRKAKEAHEFLLSSPYFIDGGPEDGSSVEEPTPKREYIYAETKDEWLARCWEMEGKR